MNEEILVVDDEPDIRSLISLTLEDEGYLTVQAANAEEARGLSPRVRHLVSFLISGCASRIWMVWKS